MSVVLQSSGGGSVTLSEPSTASNFTATFPAVTGTVVTTGDTATVTPTMLSQKLTLATAQNSTSGTSIDFTGIPSWAKRITVMFNGVSTNGTSIIQVRLGTASGFETTGYFSAAGFGASGGTTTSTSTSGLIIDCVNTAQASSARYGSMIISLVTSNTWVEQNVLYPTTAGLQNCGAGQKSLAGTLTQVRITTVNGTDTFNAGSINIMYEG